MKRKQKQIQKKKQQNVDPQEYLQASLQRFEPLLSTKEFGLLLEEVKKPLLPTIRLNPLKADPELTQKLAEEYQWKIEALPFCPQGFRVDDSGGTPVSQTAEHRLGHYYIQEAASMIPVELFDFNEENPGLTLDLAASPGGKTTHLVARGADRGLVLANDSSAGRIPALRVVLQNWGAVNSAICQFPGEKLGAWFAETFDRALIDAPCSMQGLRTSESHSTRPVTEKESLSLAKRQIALLTSALQAVKVGGQVVYSTCTLLPEEDEGVVDAVLRKFGGKVRIVTVSAKLPGSAQGLTQNGAEQYLPELVNSLRLWPHRLGTAGFFACLLEKTGSLDLSEQKAPARPMERAGFVYAQKELQLRVQKQLLQEYGFDLAEKLDEYHLTLMQRFEKIIAMPDPLLNHFSELPLEYAGLLLGEVNTGDLELSHEWVSRFGREFDHGKIILCEAQAESWLKGEDCLDLQNEGIEKGKVVVVCRSDGMVLGRGKVLKDRLKNLLLRRLV
jgi:16S rRNA (cytosine1407-C5)-methyltransferase